MSTVDVQLLRSLPPLGKAVDAGNSPLKVVNIEHLFGATSIYKTPFWARYFVSSNSADV